MLWVEIVFKWRVDESFAHLGYKKAQIVFLFKLKNKSN